MLFCPDNACMFLLFLPLLYLYMTSNSRRNIQQTKEELKRTVIIFFHALAVELALVNIAFGGFFLTNS